jgi:hypothetical protein
MHRTSRARFPSPALVCVALGLVGACQRTRPSGEPAPRATAADASAVVRADVTPPSVDAGEGGLVDLLRAPGAAVSVSSVVQNNSERPAHLVDDNPDTAWSSRTGEMEGAEIDFRVPDEATVASVALTVGMTRRTDGGDLFSMNPRVAQVAVYREGALVVRHALDVSSRALQSVPIDRPGGFYRVVVTRVVPGSRDAWREVSVSDFRVRGRWTGTLAAAPPTVTVGALARDALPTQPYALAPDGVLPPGCFAWSPRTFSAACTTGLVGHNMGAATNEESSSLQPGWRVAFVGDRARPINLVDRGASPEDFFVDAPLAAGPRARLEAALGAGGYVPLAPLYRRLRAGTPMAWAQGSTLLWTRRRTSRVGDNAAARYTDTLAVRWRAGEAPTVVSTRQDAPVDAPEYAAYFMPGERFVVLSSLAEHGDEGVSGHTAEAWRCDRTARRCE